MLRLTLFTDPCPVDKGTIPNLTYIKKSVLMKASPSGKHPKNEVGADDVSTENSCDGPKGLGGRWRLGSAGGKEKRRENEVAERGRDDAETLL